MMLHYVIWRDKFGDVRQLQRYRSRAAADEVAAKWIARHGPHQENPGGPDVDVYSAESFDILLATHPDWDALWGAPPVVPRRSPCQTAAGQPKQRHRSETEARVAAEFVGVAGLRPYHCPVCGFWHIGGGR